MNEISAKNEKTELANLILLNKTLSSQPFNNITNSKQNIDIANNIANNNIELMRLITKFRFVLVYKRSAILLYLFKTADDAQIILMKIIIEKPLNLNFGII